MISARGLTKRYGKVLAVDDVDLEIPTGRVVGFLGHNGAGKTTTIRMIAGGLAPTAGTIAVAGIDALANPREARRHLGYLPESTPLYAEMRVEAYLRFRTSLYDIPRGRRRERVETVLRQCALEDVRRRPISQLSKGYRQRVGLAAAIVHDPAVIILDEPTSGLDPSQIRDVRKLIRDLAGDHTILLSTHILPEAELTCDDIVMIARGRIQAQGSVGEMRAQAERTPRFVIETDAADAAKTLRSLQQVARVEAVPLSDGWHRLAVVGRPDVDDTADAIGRVLAAKRAAVRKFEREDASLEQMFLGLVETKRRTGAAEVRP